MFSLRIVQRGGMQCMRDLSALFNPKSVAIVGASPDVKKIGGRPLSYMQRYGFTGDIYPINPKYEDINGLRCYADILDVPGTVDVAIIALPQTAVLQSLKKCGQSGVKSVVIFSAGFGEVGEEGQRTQQQMKEIAKSYNIRLLGPNCLGIFNVRQGFYGTFSTIIEDEKPLESKIGFVSQSGAFGSHVFTLARQQNIGFSYFVATGNEADVDVADCITYFATNPNTNVIACYMEGVQDGDKLIQALQLARENNKPVIALKVGTTEAGMKAAVSHTGSIVGADEIFTTVFNQNGVYRAHTIDEFLDVTYVASQLPALKGDNVAVFTISGGVGILLADQLTESGFNVFETPADVQAHLADILPIAGTSNPIDTTAQISYIPTLLEDFMDSVLGSGQYDAAVIFLGFAGLKHDSIKARIETLDKMKKKYPHISQLPVTINSKESSKAFYEANVPVLQDPTRAVIALKALRDFERFNEREQEPKQAFTTIDLTDVEAVLTEYGSKRFLKQFNLPITQESLATTEVELIEQLKGYTFPVVLKGMSPQILHKTDKGLVSLNIQSEAQAIEQFSLLKQIIDETPEAEFEGILIQEMLKGEFTEMFIGSKRDPIFGQMVIVGLGGIYIEILKDISMRKAPISPTEALEMIGELKAHEVLHAYRGKPASDIKALSEIISQFSYVIAALQDDLLEADLNPVMVFSEGRGVKIADGLMSFNPTTKKLVHK